MTKITLEGLPVISVETKNTVLQESAREPEATNRYVKRFRQKNPHLHDALILSFKLLNYSPDLIQGASEELAFSYEFLARELENNYPTRRLPLVDISTGLEECAIASRNLDYNEEVNKRLEKENPIFVTNLQTMMRVWVETAEWPKDFCTDLIQQHWYMYELLRRKSEKNMAESN